MGLYTTLYQVSVFLHIKHFPQHLHNHPIVKGAIFKMRPEFQFETFQNELTLSTEYEETAVLT